MRQRYFSPELRYTLPSQRSSQIQKLRWVGSSAQLSTAITYDEYERQIGPYTYHVNKELGSGYSSKVYRGKRKDSNEDFAIKVIDLKKYNNSNM